MFCYDGSLTSITKPIVRFWDYLNIVITTTTPKQVSVVYGNSSKFVLSKVATHHNFSSSQPLLVSPYELRCVAVKRLASGPGDVSYSLYAEYKLAWHMPLLFLAGCFLLFAAPGLSKNVPLLYGTGIAIGILGSGIILLYIISRFLPGVGGSGMGGCGLG